MKTLFFSILTIAFLAPVQVFSQDEEDETSGPRTFNYDFGVPPVSHSESVDARRASLVMMAAWIHQINAQPEEILRGEGAWRNYAEAECLDFSNMSPTLQRWGLSELPAQPYELDDLLSLATAFGPLWVSFTSHPARPVVITGLRGTTDGAQTLVTIHDPEAGPNREMPFAEFVSGAFLSDQAVASEAAVMTVAYYPHTLANGVSMHFYTRSPTFPIPELQTFSGGAQNIAETLAGVSFNRRNQRQVVGWRSAVGVLTPSEIIENIQATCTYLQQRHGASRKIGVLSIFTHGFSEGLNFGGGYRIRNTGGGQNMATADFIRQIEPYLSDDAKLIFYACDAGAAVHSENGRYMDVAERQSGGEGCFSDVCRDLLNQNGAHREVWGHRTTTHAFKNPSWRVFSGPPNAPGSRASDPDLFSNGEASTSQPAKDCRDAYVAHLQSLPECSSCGMANLQYRLESFVGTYMPLSPPSARPFCQNGQINPQFSRFLEQHLAAWCNHY